MNLNFHFYKFFVETEIYRGKKCSVKAFNNKNKNDQKDRIVNVNINWKAFSTHMSESIVLRDRQLLEPRNCTIVTKKILVDKTLQYESGKYIQRK